MGLSLATKTPGNPDNAFQWYLHSSGTTLGTGFQVALGDGTDTALWLGTNKIGVRGSGGFVSRITSLATATREVSLADGAGVLHPALTSVLAADISESGTSYVNSGLAVTLEASGIYEVTARLLLNSAAGIGAWIQIDGPNTVTAATGIIGIPALAQTAFTDFASAKYEPTSRPSGTDPYFAEVRALVSLPGGAPSEDLRIKFRTEVNTNAVTLLKGSILTARKVN